MKLTNRILLSVVIVITIQLHIHLFSSNDVMAVILATDYNPVPEHCGFCTLTLFIDMCMCIIVGILGIIGTVIGIGWIYDKITKVIYPYIKDFVDHINSLD